MTSSCSTFSGRWHGLVLLGHGTSKITNINDSNPSNIGFTPSPNKWVQCFQIRPSNSTWHPCVVNIWIPSHGGINFNHNLKPQLQDLSVIYLKIPFIESMNINSCHEWQSTFANVYVVPSSKYCKSKWHRFCDIITVLNLLKFSNIMFLREDGGLLYGILAHDEIWICIIDKSIHKLAFGFHLRIQKWAFGLHVKIY